MKKASLMRRHQKSEEQQIKTERKEKKQSFGDGVFFVLFSVEGKRGESGECVGV